MKFIKLANGRKGKHHWGFFIFKEFQGLGLVFSFDHPIIEDKYFLFEIQLLWLKGWYTFDIIKKKK